MQVAGNVCFVCDKNVGTIPDAVGCRRCQKVAHRACGASRTCPGCQGALVPGSVLHGSADPPDLVDPVESGDPDELGQREDVIGGSLALFVGWVTMVVVFQVVVAATRVAAAVTETERLVAIALVGAGIYGGWCVGALRAANPRAPLHVHGWLGLTSVLATLLGAASGSYAGAGRPLVAWIVAALYLGKSKRVAAVYRDRRAARDDDADRLRQGFAGRAKRSVSE
jgi:hypothetical protein